MFIHKTASGLTSLPLQLISHFCTIGTDEDPPHFIPIFNHGKKLKALVLRIIHKKIFTIHTNVHLVIHSWVLDTASVTSGVRWESDILSTYIHIPELMGRLIQHKKGFIIVLTIRFDQQLRSDNI